MTTYRFTEVSVRAQKVLPCPSCSRQVRRSTTITHTINPFNRNSDGLPKSYAEVRADVDALAAAWKSLPVLCGACAPSSAT